MPSSRADQKRVFDRFLYTTITMMMPRFLAIAMLGWMHHFIIPS